MYLFFQVQGGKDTYATLPGLGYSDSAEVISFIPMVKSC